jgi:hypothetical protein
LLTVKYKFFKRFLGLVLVSLLPVVLVSCGKAQESSSLTDNSANLSASVAVSNPSFESEKSDMFEKKVVVSIENYGRLDPFVPYSEKSLVMSSVPVFSDIPLPPSVSEADNSVKDLVQAKVAGILYDRYRPTAILNVFGEDHLVKKGEMISDFYIQDIQKDYVVVKSGYNVYKTAIGGIINGATIVESTGNTLGGKFAGRRNTSSSTSDRIEIKSLSNSTQTKSTTTQVQPATTQVQPIGTMPELPKLPDSLKKVYDDQGVINS